jgi:hypothetical protein
MSLSLPAPAMVRIFEYMDPLMLARMAQVSKTWMRIVYRTSVWDPYCITFKERTKLPRHILQSRVPPDARHIGEPDSSCFHHWLIHTELAEFNKRFAGIDDPRTYYIALREYWNQRKKPCLQLIHHKMSDVLKISLPSKLADIKYIAFRIYKNVVNDKRNAYYTYISLRFCVLETLRRYTPHTIEDRGDLLTSLYESMEKTSNERADYIDAFMKNYYMSYKLAGRAVSARSVAEFSANEEWFRRNAVWDDVYFTTDRRSSAAR